MSLRNSRLGNIYYIILQRFILAKIKKGPINPDKITIIGGIIALFVPLGFYLSELLGGLLILISAVCDSLDGQFARKFGGNEKFGAFLDSTMDRLSDFFYLMGLWIVALQTQNKIVLTLLLFIALCLTLLFSYTKARIEGLGGTCNIGFMERAKRVIFILILSILLFFFNQNTLLFYSMIIYNLLLAFSVYQRILCAKEVLTQINK